MGGELYVRSSYEWFFTFFISFAFLEGLFKKNGEHKLLLKLVKIKKVFTFGGERPPVHAEPCLQARGRSGLRVKAN